MMIAIILSSRLIQPFVFVIVLLHHDSLCQAPSMTSYRTLLCLIVMLKPGRLCMFAISVMQPKLLHSEPIVTEMYLESH